jgi:hypothetical protein
MGRGTRDRVRVLLDKGERLGEERGQASLCIKTGVMKITAPNLEESAVVMQPLGHKVGEKVSPPYHDRRTANEKSRTNYRQGLLYE